MSSTNYPAAHICADFIAQSLSSSTRPNSRPLFVGFQGPQGSGKTTLTTQTQTILLSHSPPIHTVVFSIDDLYLPYSGLTHLAQSHPSNALLQGRGQPGTHDPALGAELLERLSRLNNEGEGGGVVELPVFDKSAYNGFGDRSKEVVRVKPPVDVVILEGWCFGFQPLSVDELERRYNAPNPGATKSEHPEYFRNHSLESLKHINEELKKYAELWYGHFTHFIEVVPENLHDVFEWRLQQEHAMKLKNGGIGMTDEQVQSFVARYMPGYELFLHTIENQTNPWHGNGIKIVLSKQRAVVQTDKF
ncbi:P-loop containing nucleoside triphosphate hydrolase protein [Ceratobasidium sp. AG-I]|nr:P-loop containing nucleoside triphosphate hydrolase protein [Ceratobasidium sp. AG-I]